MACKAQELSGFSTSGSQNDRFGPSISAVMIPHSLGMFTAHTYVKEVILPLAARLMVWPRRRLANASSKHTTHFFKPRALFYSCASRSMNYISCMHRMRKASATCPRGASHVHSGWQVLWSRGRKVYPLTPFEGAIEVVDPWIDVLVDWKLQS